MRYLIMSAVLAGLMALSSCASNNCFGPVPPSVQTGHDAFTAALAKP